MDRGHSPVSRLVQQGPDASPSSDFGRHHDRFVPERPEYLLRQGRWLPRRLPLFGRSLVQRPLFGEPFIWKPLDGTRPIVTTFELPLIWPRLESLFIRSASNPVADEGQ